MKDIILRHLLLLFPIYGVLPKAYEVQHIQSLLSYCPSRGFRNKEINDWIKPVRLDQPCHR
jgi:hypothetical protein